MVDAPVAFPGTCAPPAHAALDADPPGLPREPDEEDAERAADALARRYAGSTGPAAVDPDACLADALRALADVRAWLAVPARPCPTEALAAWLSTRHRALRGLLRARRDAGTLGVMADVACGVMDRVGRGRADLAFRFVNAYLRCSGDYGGIPLLVPFVVHSAVLRAHDACLRAAAASDPRRRAELRAQGRDAMRLAASLACPGRPAIVLLHGATGSGKTTFADALGALVGGIVIAAEGTGTAATHALAIARLVVRAGWVAIVDGRFPRRTTRRRFRRCAARCRVPFCIVSVQAAPATLRARAARANRLPDADEAPGAHEPLAPDELAETVVHDGAAPRCDLRSTATWHALAARLPIVASAEVPPIDGEAMATQRAIVEHLADPRSYPQHPSRVERIETHLSWVFVTDAHAFKMKKHARTRYVDLRSVEARRHNGEEEVRLNRRLADDVYVACIPLLADDAGHLSFTTGDEVVEWLVQMRRLPAHRMMDRLLVDGALAARDVDAIVARLCAYYRRAPAAGLAADAYRARLLASTAEWRNELCRPGYALPAARIEALYARQCRTLAQAPLFAGRVRAGRIVEGHGDLRPEHVCVEARPQIIDCLDFSRPLRTLDTADEIAFLALECERLGAPAPAVALLRAYRERCGDAVPDELVAFYRRHRACVRATLAIRHLDEPVRDRATWHAKALAYLALAEGESPA